MIIIINANLKNKNTKIYNKNIRNIGYIPSIIYNKNTNISIIIKESQFISKNKLIKLNNKKNIFILLKNTKIEVIIKNIQYHIYKNKILHIDFIKI